MARAGRRVLTLEGIRKSYDETVVDEGVDLSIERENRVALVGPNGAGKSTLLRIAAGVLNFDAGERTLGHNATVAFFAQHQLEVLDPRRSVLEELETAANLDDIPRLRGHLGAFLFSGDDVKKKVSVLSGGEKSRLALAKLLLRPSNFLVLDEPTNHLDLTSREILEDALRGYGGTLLLISHDRAFLNALVNRVVEVDHGQLQEYPGNYDDYLRKKTTGKPRRPEPPKLEPAQAPESRPEPQPAARLSKQERIAARERDRDRMRRHKRATKRLAEVEEEIRASEQRLEEFSWRLGDPDVHRDPEAIREIEAERDEIKGRVDGFYREWERLAAEVEAGEQGVG
ncbi:MAG: ABC-F family ATP-binding cassette domain-containing protein [Deltaproteobacteria bacterium]|nr:ABC-F family ATP-binding cassette domain-containing protein [Deltaproteobacteria bacterium]